ncbi:hypothetical protein OPV22_021794 [Ensete ventricosum]|uniref:Uncharacterized protein n=1 Tax=Ensete ventricosum TaxID=4639 RepID=A0AAV8QPC0_ENSVE|nr:hypothetical protein OPV22_021794 [Ensete ventricosum]
MDRQQLLSSGVSGLPLLLRYRQPLASSLSHPRLLLLSLPLASTTTRPPLPPITKHHPPHPPGQLLHHPANLQAGGVGYGTTVELNLSKTFTKQSCSGSSNRSSANDNSRHFCRVLVHLMFTATVDWYFLNSRSRDSPVSFELRELIGKRLRDSTFGENLGRAWYSLKKPLKLALRA